MTHFHFHLLITEDSALINQIDWRQSAIEVNYPHLMSVKITFSVHPI